jgi:hypothetical protein
MGSVLQARVEEAREIERTLVHGSARLCTRNFGIAWRAIFPIKAKEELAVRAGMSVRAASYELAGEREPSPQSLMALLGACLEKR